MSSNMDFSESTKVVFQKIQELEPENVSKIMGSLLLKVNNEREMIQLAFCPDALFRSLVDKVKLDLGLHPKPPGITRQASRSTDPRGHGTGPLASNHPGTTLANSINPSYSEAAAYHHWNPHHLIPMDQQFFINDPRNIPMIFLDMYNAMLQNQAQFMPVNDQHHMQTQSFFLPPQNIFPGFPGGFYPGPNNHQLAQNPVFPVNPRADQRSREMREYICPKDDSPQFAMRICEYFKQGYCWHGENCKLLHVVDMKNGYVMVLNDTKKPEDDVHLMRERGLRKLEKELIEILKWRRGIPVAITCLPILYQERYQRKFDVEAYLPQGQGREGCVLTQVVAQMISKGMIYLINRQHIMQSIILAEDEPLYMRFIEKKGKDESSASDSCKIYLTFSPSCVFSDEDVLNYFIHFGPVQDIRIPCHDQEKRMYGFVSFVYPETVSLVLSMSNPHVIGGAHIMVKPYEQKQNKVDDSKIERNMEEQPMINRKNPAIILEAEPKSNNISSNLSEDDAVLGEVENGQSLSVDIKGKSIVFDQTYSLGHVSILRRKTADETGLSKGACVSNGECSTIGTKVDPEGKYSEENHESYINEEELGLPDNPFGFEAGDGSWLLM